MTTRPICITLLASEWASSKGGLSTMNRELAIQLAKLSNTSVSFFVPKCNCCDEDKREASSYNVKIVEAEERPGYEPIDWLTTPPEDLVINFVIGHGVILGKQAQFIRKSHQCKWIQVVHTAPDELAVYKEYSRAISKGDEKQSAELKLCKMADLVVAIGPKLTEFYAALLNYSGKKVYNFTPGIFNGFASLDVSSMKGKKFRILVFGRGDTEDFKLKGYDIAAKAVAKLDDKSYHLTFVGASKGSESDVTKELLRHDLLQSQLIVKGYLENREDLLTLLCASNLVIISSRTEGFGLTALEALSAGIPFLVSQNSGFGEALQEIPRGSAFIVDSEDPEDWAEAIKATRQKGSDTVFQQCQELRALYAEKYKWEKQSQDLVRTMKLLINEQPSIKCQNDKFASLTPRGASAYQQDVRLKDQSPSSSSTNQSSLTAQGAPSSLLKRKLLHVPNEKKFKAQGAPSSLLKRKLLKVPNEKKFKASSIASLEGFSANLFPEKSQGNSTTMQDLSETTRHDTSDERHVTAALAILSCSVSATSFQAVEHVLEIIGNTVTFIRTREYKGRSPTQVKDYLKRETLPRLCLLLVDAGEVNHACQNSTLQVEYKDLFETVLDRVAEKVVIVVCSDCYLSQENEVQLFIEGVFDKREKGFIVWLKDGALSVDPDTLAHILIPG